LEFTLFIFRTQTFISILVCTSIQIPTLIFRSFKPGNWLRHKTFKSHTFNACKWPWLAIYVFWSHCRALYNS
jgi:hypothetical protein